MDADAPTVTILLLGDPGCGKSTFLAKMSLGARLIAQPVSPSNPLPSLRDYDQPFVFNISMYNRPYRFEIYDTSSPENYTLLSPDLIIMCYDVNDRRTLSNVDEVWSKQVARTWLSQKEDIPVTLLGLKRDLRRAGAGVIYPQEVGTHLNLAVGRATISEEQGADDLAGTQDCAGAPVRYVCGVLGYDGRIDE